MRQLARRGSSMYSGLAEATLVFLYLGSSLLEGTKEHTMSHDKGGSVLSSEFPKAARRETEETHAALKDMIDQFTAMVSDITFVSTTIAPAGGLLEATATLELRDGNGIKILFGDNAAKRVQLDVTGNAAGGVFVDDEGNEVTSGNVRFVKGEAVVTAKATGTGTVILTLTDVDSTGLSLGGAATITFS